MVTTRTKRRASARPNRTPWIVGAVVFAIGAASVIAVASGTTPDPTHGTGALPAPSSLVNAVTSIPARVYAEVGLGTAAPLPEKLPGPLLAAAGKPRVVYIGAEYCPYCATERWAMVAALARFGTFSGLKTSHSSPLDQFADTPTLSFYKSTYTSPYLTFEGVEQQTNIFSGGNYTKLDDTTAEQLGLLNRFDYPPYVDKLNEGAIPFVDFANEYLVAGATYPPQTLQGKSPTAAAAAMRDPSTAISQGAVGSANMMTAVICKLTGGKPASVCRAPAMARIRRRIG